VKITPSHSAVMTLARNPRKQRKAERNVAFPGATMIQGSNQIADTAL
jgi:hypothetical protein